MSERTPITITIDLPLPPRASHPNARAHHLTEAKAKKKQKQDAGFATLVAMRKAGIKGPLQAALVSSHWKLAKENDPDNLIAWLKATFDGIVIAGLLADDNKLLPMVPTQEFLPKRSDAPKRGVVLVVTELVQATEVPRG